MTNMRFRAEVLVDDEMQASVEAADLDSCREEANRYLIQYADSAADGAVVEMHLWQLVLEVLP